MTSGEQRLAQRLEAKLDDDYLLLKDFTKHTVTGFSEPVG